MPKPHKSDTEKLCQFLVELGALLGEVLSSSWRADETGQGPDERDWVQPPELRTLLLAAMNEYEGVNHRVVLGLKKLPTGELVRVGLTKEALDAKLYGYDHATRTYRKRRRKRTKKPPWILRHALKWADVILGSLASVIPASEFLKEYKESVELGLERARQ